MEENKRPFEELLIYMKKAGIKNPEVKLQFFQENLLKFINNPERHHHILLTTYNVPDGIGDFVNLLDYYAWMKDIFKSMQNVHIHAVGVVSSSKIAIAKKVLPDGFDTQNNLPIIDIGNMQDITLDSKGIIIVKCDNKKFLGEVMGELNLSQLSDIFRNCANLQTLFKNANLLLNLATPFEAIDNIFLTYINPSSCLIRSILEYGPQQTLGSHLKKNSHEYTELSMGFDRDEVGIKFNEAIFSERGANQLKKADKLLELNNIQLLKRILNSEKSAQEEAENYFDKYHFGMGYLQSEKHTCNFIKLLVATSQDKDIDAIIDTNQFKLEQIKEYLEKNNIRKILLYENTGDPITAYEISSSLSSGKSIRLFKYAGSTNHDTNIFFTIADVAGGSGDKSLSNVIACGAFPFIGSLGHKYETTAELIKYIKNIPNLNDREILIEYLSNMAEKKVDMDKQCSFAELHYQSIKEAWFLAGTHIYQHKNAKPYFIEVVYNYLLFRLFERHDCTNVVIDAMKDIYRNINLSTVKICKQALLLLAIDCNNSKAVKELLKLEINLDVKTKKLKLTPLQYSLRMKQEGIAIVLIRAGARLDQRFLGTPNALAYAIQEGLSVNLINEIIKYMKEFIFYEKDQLMLVMKYITRDEQLKSSFIDKNLDTKNLCLYYAIKTNNIDLTKLALKSGAYIDLNDINTLGRDYFDFDTDRNTLLHLACETNNFELVKLLLNVKPNIFIFDISNEKGRTAISLTKNSNIITLLQSKPDSNRENFWKKTGFKPFAIGYDPTSVKPEITIKFHRNDAAWQTWKQLRAFNIIVPRPKPIVGTLDQVITVPKELLEAYMQGNVVQTVKPNNYVIKIFEMELKLKEAINMVKIQLLGANGLELIFPNNQAAVKVHQLLTQFGIQANYHEKILTQSGSHVSDSTIEITSIDSDDVFNSFQLMLKYQQLLHSLKEMSNINNIQLKITDKNVIINVDNEGNAVKLWLALLTNHIFCEPPELETQLSIQKETILAFLNKTLIHEPLNDILKEVLKETNRQKLAHLFDDKIALTAYGANGLIVTFNSDEKAEKAKEILENKNENLWCDKHRNTLLLQTGLDLEELMEVLNKLEPITKNQANQTTIHIENFKQYRV